MRAVALSMGSASNGNRRKHDRASEYDSACHDHCGLE
jgi:hypothetical protein